MHFKSAKRVLSKISGHEKCFFENQYCSSAVKLDAIVSSKTLFSMCGISGLVPIDLFWHFGVVQTEHKGV